VRSPKLILAGTQATDLATFRIDLFSENSLTVTLPISTTVTTATGQLLFTFPG
jgi:hypothetical protein